MLFQNISNERKMKSNDDRFTSTKIYGASGDIISTKKCWGDKDMVCEVEVADFIPTVSIEYFYDKYEGVSYNAWLTFNNKNYPLAAIIENIDEYLMYDAIEEDNVSISKETFKNIETSVQRIMESQTIRELWLNVAEVFPDQFNQMLQDNNIINL